MYRLQWSWDLKFGSHKWSGGPVVAAISGPRGPVIGKTSLGRTDHIASVHDGCSSVTR